LLLNLLKPRQRSAIPAFLSKDTMRSGEIVAMAQDAIDLADAPNHPKFAVIGHDWGARIAYALAIAVPQRISRICGRVGWLAAG
jgi:pimeloyl-ACP methyl ester carboxylesterase